MCYQLSSLSPLILFIVFVINISFPSLLIKAFANDSNIQLNSKWELTLDLPFHHYKKPATVSGRVKNLLFSAGVDKRIKIRDIESEEIIKTLFVPSMGAHDGLLHSIALDESEEIVVVGGDTKKGGRGLNQLYFINWIEEKLIHSIPVSREPIVDVSLSSNGKFAVTVSREKLQYGASYIRIIRLPSGEKIFEKKLDTVSYVNFIDKNYFLTTSFRIPNNNPATCFELYSISGKVISEHCTNEFIYFNSKPVIRTDLRKKELQLFLNPLGVDRKSYKFKYPNFGEVSKTAITKIPRNILAKFNFDVDGNSAKRWPFAGAPSTLKAHKNGTVIDLIRFDNLKPNQNEAYKFDEMPILDVLRFDLNKRALARLHANDLNYKPSRPSSPIPNECEVTKMENSPLDNTRLLSNNYCFSYESKHDLGTTETVLADEQGQLVWDKNIDKILLSVSLSNNKNMLIMFFNSGIVEWRSVKTGDIILSAYFAEDGSNWVVWDSKGNFDATLGFERAIGWLEKETSGLPRFYSAYQFERFGYSPDKIDLALKRMQEKAASYLQPSLSSLGPMQEPNLPLVNIDHAKTKVISAGSELLLKFAVNPIGTTNKNISVFVNDIPVFSSQKNFKKRKYFSTSIPLGFGKNVIHIESLNDQGMGYEKTIIYNKNENKKKTKGKLRVIAIGINKYNKLSDPSFTLNYAINDAKAIASHFKGLTDSYDSVEVVELNDNAKLKPTKNNILKTLKLLEKSNYNDTNIVFIAAHGTNDNVGNYYVLPSDVTDIDLNAFNTGSKSNTEKTSNRNKSAVLSWQELHAVLSRILGKRILILDTCHAAGARGIFSPRSLSYKSASSSYAILAASGPGEYSQELDEKKQGLFTYALLQSFSAGSDINNDETVDLEEVFLNAKKYTAKITEDLPTSQTPLLIANNTIRKTPIFKGKEQTQDRIAQLNTILKNAKPFDITMRYQNGIEHTTTIRELPEKFKWGVNLCDLDYLNEFNTSDRYSGDRYFMGRYRIRLKDLKRPVAMLDSEAYKKIALNALVVESLAMKERYQLAIEALHYDYVGPTFWSVVFRYRDPNGYFPVSTWELTPEEMETSDRTKLLSTKALIQKLHFMTIVFKHKKEAEIFLDSMNKLIDRCQL